VLAIGMSRYIQLQPEFVLQTSRLLLIGVTVAMILSSALPILREGKNRSVLSIALIVLLIGLLIVTKLLPW